MIEIRWVVTGWDVSTGLLNIWAAVAFLLFLSFDLSHSCRWEHHPSLQKGEGQNWNLLGGSFKMLL